MPGDEPSFVVAQANLMSAALSPTMVSKVHTHSRLSLQGSGEAPGTPLPSDSLHEGERSFRSPSIRFRSGSRRTSSWRHDRDASSIHAPGAMDSMHPWRTGSSADWLNVRHECRRLPDIGPTFRDDDRLRYMSVPHISLTLSVMVVPSCGLASVPNVPDRASHRRGLARTPA